MKSNKTNPVPPCPVKANEIVTSHKGTKNRVFYMMAIDSLATLRNRYPNFNPAICGSVGRLLQSITNAGDIKFISDYSVGDLDLVIPRSEIVTIPDCFIKSDSQKLVKGTGYDHYRCEGEWLPVCLFVIDNVTTKKVFNYDVQVHCHYPNEDITF